MTEREKRLLKGGAESLYDMANMTINPVNAKDEKEFLESLLRATIALKEIVEELIEKL